MPLRKVPAGTSQRHQASAPPSANRPWPPSARCQRVKAFWNAQAPSERAAKAAMLLDAPLCQRLHQRRVRLLQAASGDKSALDRASELSRKYGVHEMHARKTTNDTVELFWGPDAFSNEAVATLLERCPRSLEDWSHVQHVGKCEAEQPLKVEVMFAAHGLLADGPNSRDYEWAYIGRAFYGGLVQQLCSLSVESVSRPEPAPEARLPMRGRRKIAQALAAKRDQDLVFRVLASWNGALAQVLPPPPRYVLVVKNTFVDTFWEDTPSARRLEEDGNVDRTKRPRPPRALSVDACGR